VGRGRRFQWLLVERRVRRSSDEVVFWQGVGCSGWKFVFQRIGGALVSVNSTEVTKACMNMYSIMEKTSASCTVFLYKHLLWVARGFQ